MFLLRYQVVLELLNAIITNIFSSCTSHFSPHYECSLCALLNFQLFIFYLIFTSVDRYQPNE